MAINYFLCAFIVNMGLAVGWKIIWYN